MAIEKVKIYSLRILQNIKKLGNRGSVANMLMISFIMFSALGTFLIYVPAGFIATGVACGIFGFLLGQE
jgi:hypothetical protein